jgi:DNA repair protein RadC
VTARLKQALALVDVRLLDHIIVGGAETALMAARGSN